MTGITRICGREFATQDGQAFADVNTALLQSVCSKLNLILQLVFTIIHHFIYRTTTNSKLGDKYRRYVYSYQWFDLHLQIIPVIL